MKREIICLPCEGKARKLFPNENPYPGEHVKFVIGAAKGDFECDHCGNPIEYGGQCCAFSIWADHGAQPYWAWESDFIETKKGHGHPEVTEITSGKIDGALWLKVDWSNDRRHMVEIKNPGGKADLLKALESLFHLIKKDQNI